MRRKQRREERAYGYHPGGGKRAAVYLRAAALVLCAGVLIFSLYMLIDYAASYFRSRAVSREMKEAYLSAQASGAEKTDTLAIYNETDAPMITDAPAPAQAVETAANPFSRTAISEYPDNPYLMIADEFVVLRRKNADIAGWLTIEGVTDEAVVRRDNSYYMTHDYLGGKSAGGALFLDERCQLRTPPENLIIFGHNMKTGAMFGKLIRYKTEGRTFLLSHGFAEFNTLYEKGQYVVIAVLIADVRPEQPLFLNFMNSLTFSTDSEFMSYIEKIRERSLYRIPVDVAPGDRLLTLCTCTVNDTNERLLVIFRKLRAGETEASVKMQFALSTAQ